VHPTTFIPSNKLFSADFCRVATRRFEDTFAGRRPLAMYTNGNQGDLIIWFDDYNQHAVADRIGTRVANAMTAAWQEAGAALSSDVVIDAHSTTVSYQGQEVEPGKRVGGPVGFWGASFFGGAQNGPSIFYWLGTEGKRRPAALADPVHGRKIIAAPAPWFPNVELQALRGGGGPVTVRAGRLGDRGPGERLPQLLHHPRGVRPAALRGRRRLAPGRRRPRLPDHLVAVRQPLHRPLRRRA
jgi:neutral ceramidase